jgi:hypothetical protein
MDSNNGPWTLYPPDDPRSQSTNWGYNATSGQYYVLYGPDDPNVQTATLSPPTPSASGYYGGVDSSGMNTQPGYVRKTTIYPAADAAPTYTGSGYGANGYPAPAPLPGTPAGTNRAAADGAAPPAPAPTGYATTPAGDNFSVDAARFAEYENYLASANAPAMGPVAAPPGVQDPLTLAPQTIMGGNGVPNAGALTGAGNYPDPYGGGGSAPYGGQSAGGGYPYPTIPGMPPPTYEPMGGPPDPRSFDPFAFSGTSNPMPPSNAMRGQVMGAGGFPGPAWAQAPEPPPNRETLMRAMKMGGEIALANQPQGPRPMTGIEYVARRLKLDPNGGRQQGF